MENVFKIIYDKTKAKKIIGINDIENILALVINEKCLNYYIKNINVQPKEAIILLLILLNIIILQYIQILLKR